MQNYEKLGALYLGRQLSQGGEETDDLLLYDSRDLNTHAVIIGMTGSGKTGLGVGLIEEAAIDHIPVIAIDPKGDLGNLLLTFPELRPEDFEPWVNSGEAEQQGQSVADYAASVAETWRNGLNDWGQSSERISLLCEASDRVIYTPGSSAGRSLSVLQEFTQPAAEVMADADLYQEQLQSTVSGLLTLLGIDADPLQSREHILLAAVLDGVWQAGQSLDLAGLIAAIQQPAFDRIGVMALDSFYPAKDRFTLAMQLNNLLAAPGFKNWLQGEPLDMDRILYTEAGKPRVAVMSIAHLDDQQRMFFVTMLLNELLGWMRSQPGSSSLRAILYMDEVFGYMPPVANPPSKQLLLTLLKQARAFGVGLVLSTQNPVDLDYKGLSNAGTWFIGRLQTERDKARVREGLQSADAGGGLDAGNLDDTLASLGKRQFLLHNVHEEGPVVFATRWVMSFLAGPLTRNQIKALTATEQQQQQEQQQEPSQGHALSASVGKSSEASAGAASARPVLPPDVEQYFVLDSNATDSAAPPVYQARLVASGKLHYHNARIHLNAEKTFAWVVEPDASGRADWRLADPLPEGFTLARRPEPNAQFVALPAALASSRHMNARRKDLLRWIRLEQPLILFKSPQLRAVSEVDESERDFRIRLQRLANEQRDRQVDKLRDKYERRFVTQRERIRRADQTVQREAEQATTQKLDVAVSFGTALLGALLGRRRLSSGTVDKIGTTARKASRAGGQAADVQRAEASLQAARDKLEQLEEELREEVADIDSAYDAQQEQLQEITVRARSGDVQLEDFGIGWFSC